jgi:hypothetical protein
LKVATLGTKWDMRTSSRMAGYGGVGDWLTSAGCGAAGVVPQEVSARAWAQVRLKLCDSLKLSLCFATGIAEFFASKRQDPPIDYLASYSRDILGFFPRGGAVRAWPLTSVECRG